MKDAYYFSHDANARRDPKILMLRAKYGAKGYAYYFMILEMMREMQNYKLMANEFLYQILAIELGTDEKEVKEFLDFCISLQLFNQKDGELYSESFIYRMQRKEMISSRRAEAGKAGAEKRWQNDGKMMANGMANGMANQWQTDSKPIALKESKEKESKEKESKENNITTTAEKVKIFKKPTVPEIRDYCLSRKNGIDAEQFWNFYESKGWKVGKAPMKDWQAAVRTWERSRINMPAKIDTKPANALKTDIGDKYKSIEEAAGIKWE